MDHFDNLLPFQYILNLAAKLTLLSTQNTSLFKISSGTPITYKIKLKLPSLITAHTCSLVYLNGPLNLWCPSQFYAFVLLVLFDANAEDPLSFNQTVKNPIFLKSNKNEEESFNLFINLYVPPIMTLFLSSALQSTSSSLRVLDYLGYSSHIFSFIHMFSLLLDSEQPESTEDASALIPCALTSNNLYLNHKGCMAKRNGMDRKKTEFNGT